MSASPPPPNPSNDDTFDEIENLLECCICLEMCTVPIHQCIRGHIICLAHMDQLKTCPKCRGSYSEGGSSRNTIAEWLLSNGLNLIQHLQKVQFEIRQQVEEQFVQGVQMDEKSTQTELDVCVQLNSNDPMELTSSENSSTRPTSESTIVNSVSEKSSVTSVAMCRYAEEGCPYENESTSQRTEKHERTCDYRPIACSAKVDDGAQCINASIPFGTYIDHLKKTHNLSNFHGNSSDCYKYYLKFGNTKLVHDGFANLFILELNDGGQFIVRAAEREDGIVIWVAFHGNVHTGLGWQYDAQIDFFNRNDSDASVEGINANDCVDKDETNNIINMQQFTTFSGPVVISTRITTKEEEGLLDNNDYLFIGVDNVRKSLGKEMIGRNELEYWSVKVTISKNE